jgi:ribosome-associated protein
MLRHLDFTPELKFRTSRSGGKGGQNVNKVETRVELEFKPAESALLNSEQKEKILQKFSNRISSDGTLRLVSDTHRSQYRNKEDVIEKFYELLEYALRTPKKRKPTKPHKGAVERRLGKKKKLKEKKAMRKYRIE